MEGESPRISSRSPRGHLDCSLTYSNTDCHSNALIPSSHQEIELVLSRLKQQRIRLIKAQISKPPKQDCFMKLKEVPCQPVFRFEDQPCKNRQLRSTSQNRFHANNILCHRKAKTQPSDQTHHFGIRHLKKRFHSELPEKPSTDPLKACRRPLVVQAKGYFPTTNPKSMGVQQKRLSCGTNLRRKLVQPLRNVGCM